MVLESTISSYPTTMFCICLLFIVSILSIGQAEFVISRPVARSVLRLFFYDCLFTYGVFAFHMYSMRKLELLMGSHKYMSVIFSSLLFISVQRCVLFYFFEPTYGCISVMTIFTTLYHNLVPRARSDSLYVYKEIRVSKTVLYWLLTFCVSLTSGVLGLLDLALGVLFARLLLLPGLVRNWLVPFPFVLSELVVRWMNALSESRERYVSVDSSTPFIAYSDYLERDFVSLQSRRSTNSVSQESVAQLMDLGFSRFECEGALRSHDNDVNRAANYLLSRV